MDETIDFFRRRRQPEYVQINPANQADPIRLRRRLDAHVRSFSRTKASQRPHDPGILDRRGSHVFYGLEGQCAVVTLAASAGESSGIWPLIDPGPQQPDLLLRKRCTLGRHGLVGIEAGDEFDQAALVAMAGHDCRLAGIAAVDQAVAEIYAKLLSCFFGPWHSLHRCCKIGSMSRTKSTVCFAAGGSVLGVGGAAVLADTKPITAPIEPMTTAVRNHGSCGRLPTEPRRRPQVLTPGGDLRSGILGGVRETRTET